MNHHDWEHFGDDVRRIIQDAVEYGNYDRLNQTITNTINKATEWASQNRKHAGGASYTGYRQPVYQQPAYQQPNYAADSQQTREEYFKINTSTKVAGILFTVFGAVFSIPIALFFLIILLGGIVSGDFSVGFWALSIPSFLLLVVFGTMAFKGIKRLLQIGRFNLYKKEIGNAEMCNVPILASCVGKPIDFVVKDVEMMIRKGWFRQGHFDNQKTCLIVTNKMYQQYLQLEKQKEMQHQEEQARADKNEQLSPEVRNVIAQGEHFVKKIRQCNDDIPGEVISEKIYRIEVVVQKIFDRVKQNPNSVSDIRKLMEYYLPTTVKLLEAYVQMDAQPVGGTNIQTAKREIEATLDTLNVAFEKLLDSLFQDTAWDVSSDISVLNTMLAREGLKEDGLKK